MERPVGTKALENEANAPARLGANGCLPADAAEVAAHRRGT
eukprot:COSAG02_NODE_1546_length_11977_cov_3.458586_11_plen_41_part_00